MSPRRGGRLRGPIVWAAAITAVGLALLALVLMPLGRAREPGVGGQLVGKVAPGLDAPDLAGRRWTLGDADGRVVWVNFWATWCPPCRTEMPAMQRLHERFGDRVLILGVDFGEEAGAVADFIDRYGITYPILLDPQLNNFYRWSPQFGLPRHYFVDGTGRVVREFPGELSPESMVETLEQLLREAQPGATRLHRRPRQPSAQLTPVIDRAGRGHRLHLCSSSFSVQGGCTAEWPDARHAGFG